MLLPDGKPDAYYIGAFLEALGLRLGEDKLIADVTGEHLLVGTALFTDTAKTARAGKPVYKMFKDDRRLYMRPLAETLLTPQEVWEQWEWLNAAERIALRRRSIALWDIGDDTRPGLTVFE